VRLREVWANEATGLPSSLTPARGFPTARRRASTHRDNRSRGSAQLVYALLSIADPPFWFSGSLDSLSLGSVLVPTRNVPPSPSRFLSISQVSSTSGDQIARSDLLLLGIQQPPHPDGNVSYTSCSLWTIGGTRSIDGASFERENRELENLKAGLGIA
jgi:hypothetical protein